MSSFAIESTRRVRLKGVWYYGTYEALVTNGTFERVQNLRELRMETRHRKGIHEFTFSGLVRYAHCGCTLVR
jgi:hypothetical protein